MQYGKSLIFIRTPETYYALNKIRTEKINLIPIPIQRGWRRYKMKMGVDEDAAHMSELYSKNKKARRYVVMIFSITYTHSFL